MKHITILLIILLGGCNGAKSQSHLADADSLFHSVKMLGGVDYDFQALKGKPHVFIFYSTECPLSQKYTLTLGELNQKYSDKIKFVGVFPGFEDKTKSFEAFKNKYQIEYDLIKDERLALTSALGATITPEVFLVNQSGKIVYHGAVDDWVIRLGKTKQQATEHYLENAIKGLLNHATIQPAYVKPFGCYIEQ